MFRKVDCLLLRVPDLAAALEFYRDRLGLPTAWIRPGQSVGLHMSESDTELVLSQEDGFPETDLLVDSADGAGREFVKAGGTMLSEPFDVPIGRCCRVKDPWGNELVLLDMSKGPLKVDQRGRVVE